MSSRPPMLESRISHLGDLPGGVQQNLGLLRVGDARVMFSLNTSFMRKLTAPMEPMEHMLPNTSSQNEYRSREVLEAAAVWP